MDPNLKLREQSNGSPMDKGRYQSLMGKLIYLSHTRPDITFAVSCASIFIHSPFEKHMEVVYRILKYLKGNPGKGLFFGKSKERGIEVFINADEVVLVNDKRSTSSYSTLVLGNLVTWRSKKQTAVARSGVEAKFRVIAHGICELLWLKLLLEELQATVKLPLKICSDNKVTINVLHNLVHHDRTKHVEVDQHFIKEKVCPMSQQPSKL